MLDMAMKPYNCYKHNVPVHRPMIDITSTSNLQRYISIRAKAPPLSYIDLYELIAQEILKLDDYETRQSVQSRTAQGNAVQQVQPP
jgi:hypothetical protein